MTNSIQTLVHEPHFTISDISSVFSSNSDANASVITKITKITREMFPRYYIIKMICLVHCNRQP